MVCVALGVLGFIGVIVCCALPRWKVSSFTGSNIVTAQVTRRRPQSPSPSPSPLKPWVLSCV